MNSHVLPLLVRNDLRSRFVGNAFGAFWILALPLIQLALFAFVFGVIFEARVPGLGENGYLAFLALGMWPWLAFSEAVARGGSAICDSAALIGKVAIEPALLVLARTLTAFLVHGAGYLLVLMTVTLIGVPLDIAAAWPAVLAGWMVLLPLAFAAALVAAVVQVFFRDLQQLLPMLLAALMYLSPILYASSMLPAGWAEVLDLSPIAAVLALVRDSLLFGRASGMPLGIGVLGLVLCLLPAWALYRRLRPHLEDFL